MVDAATLHAQIAGRRHQLHLAYHLLRRRLRRAGAQAWWRAATAAAAAAAAAVGARGVAEG